MQHDIILIRYGELALKSRYVRNKFEQTLQTNIATAFKKEQQDVNIHRQHGRLLLKTPTISKATPILRRIMGIVSFSPAKTTPATLKDLNTTLVKYASSLLSNTTSFALRVRRSGTHPFTSQQAAERLGATLQHHTHAPVDLTHPDQEIFIEIRDNHAYIFSEKIPGPAGLPTNTQGTLCALITRPQSLLSAWYLLKRGCTLHFAPTQTTLHQPIQQFSDTWYITADITPVTAQQTLPKILKKNHCLALVTDHSLSEHDTNLLSTLKKLKQDLQTPILTPLLTLTQQQIHTQLQKVIKTP